MNVLILGDYCFERIYTVLKQWAKRIVVIAHQQPEYDITSDPGVEWRVISMPLDQQTVLQLIDEIAADLVLPRVRGTENEVEIIEYALAARAVPAHVLYATHSIDFARITTNKVLFHQFVLDHHLPAPRGAICHTADGVSFATKQLGGFPLVIKANCAPAGKGVRYIGREEDFCTFFATHSTGPYLLQELIKGEELGIEIVSSLHGSWRFPLISMGILDSQLNPLLRMRTAPRKVNAEIASKLDNIIHCIESILHPFGPWQIDLALSENDLYVLEVNPRLGGLTNLSFYTTGLDPHVVTCLAALGQPSSLPMVFRAAFELPIARGTEITSTPIHDLLFDIRRARSQPNWRLSIGAKDIASVTSFIKQIPSHTLLLSSSDMLDKVKATFAYLDEEEKVQ